MTTRNLVRTVLLVGSIAVLGPMALVLHRTGSLDLVEALAQLLLVAILAAAMLGGRRAGLAAALSSMMAYVLLRTTATQVDTWTMQFAVMLAIRVLSFGVLGLVVGEMASRAPYEIARRNDPHSVDEWSGVFNQKHFMEATRKALSISPPASRWSLVLIASPRSVGGESKPPARRRATRHFAARLRLETRPSHPIAHLDDGRFVIGLPKTGSKSADRFAAHLRHGLGDHEGRDHIPSLDVYTWPEDESRLCALVDALADRDRESE